jgi:hypothetical protein
LNKAQGFIWGQYPAEIAAVGGSVIWQSLCGEENKHRASQRHLMDQLVETNHNEEIVPILFRIQLRRYAARKIIGREVQNSIYQHKRQLRAKISREEKPGNKRERGRIGRNMTG